MTAAITDIADTAKPILAEARSAFGFDPDPQATTTEAREPATGCSAVWDSFSKTTPSPHEQQIVPSHGLASDGNISLRSAEEPTNATLSTGILQTEPDTEGAGHAQTLEPVLIVDSDPAFREGLAREFRAAGFRVITADTGERAILTLRDWQHPVGWLYSRAALPGLIDGAILADEYHDNHPARPAIISAQRAGFSAHGDVLPAEPTIATVLETVRQVIDTASMIGAALPVGDRWTAH